MPTRSAPIVAQHPDLCGSRNAGARSARHTRPGRVRSTLHGPRPQPRGVGRRPLSTNCAPSRRPRGRFICSLSNTGCPREAHRAPRRRVGSAHHTAPEPRPLAAPVHERAAGDTFVGVHAAGQHQHPVLADGQRHTCRCGRPQTIGNRGNLAIGSIAVRCDPESGHCAHNGHQHESPRRVRRSQCERR